MTDEQKPVVVELGREYRDIVSGFVGIATSVTEFLYACRRVTLEGVNATNEPKAFAFDEPSLELVESGRKITVPKELVKTGGPEHGSVEVSYGTRVASVAGNGR